VDGVAAPPSLTAAPGRLVALVGPTASGKSALALRLAEETGAEIVSCDSLQVYRGLDIGSAKPTVEERRRVRHHLVDVVDPDQEFSAADYARLARAALADIHARGRVAVVAGGTGLYLRALVRGLFAGPSRDAEFRRRLEALAERFGDGKLHHLLARVDPASAARLEPRDRVRVVRALEVFRASGRPLTEHHRAGSDALEGFAVLTLGLAPDRERLREAVERRTHQMMASGLVAEVRGLLERYPAGLRPLQAIGYRQAVAVVQGRLPEDAALRDIVKETMRYAKRQMTWFRHQEDVRWCAEAGEAHALAVRWLRDAA
jgi:tRNA dimethylallyltransferase